jgi:hypothetical protein
VASLSIIDAILPRYKPHQSETVCYLPAARASVIALEFKTNASLDIRFLWFDLATN